MKILLASHAFAPAIGGLETVARVLADEFVACGHEVTVVTQTPSAHDANLNSNAAEPFAYRIVRQPGMLELLRLVRWCDVYYQHNISLRTLWPRLLVNRPWVPSHHTWLTRVDGSTGWQDEIKRFFLRFGSPLAVSAAIARQIGRSAVVIGNPYQDTLFRELPDVPRTRDIVFLARLVSDKGGDLILLALGILLRDGLVPTLTIIGEGPERENLRELAHRLGIATQVTFAGMLTGETLVRTLNAHRIMAVPSRLAEPFGVVALEGIACGCVVVGSERGGLSDAVGPCGLTFPNGDADALANRIGRLLLDEDLRNRLRAQAPAHLERHSPKRIAQEYLGVFERAAR